MGVSFSLVLTSLSLASFLWNSISEDDSPVTWALQALDSFGNAATVLLLSGSHRLPALSQRMSRHVRPVQHRAVPAKEWSPDWQAKVEELSLRGMTLRSLLQFYHEDLPSVQDWMYVPKEHRTRDVVRRVIIPFTSKEETAYAVSALNRDGAQRPAVMVSHNWGNCFKDLLAAVISDALGESCFNLVAQLLEDDCDVLAGILARSSRLDDRYWICAFAVNQHMSICHSNPYDRDPLTTELHPVCNCKCVNISDPDGHSAPSEINKFDEMMSHLANTGGCRQVIAVDRSFDLFSRAWCVAEIAEGRRLHMSQSLKLASKAIIQQRARSLGKLDVRNMRASSETDKELILNKIKNQRSKNIDDFNVELQSLIFDPESGLMATWHAMDSLQQMGEVGRLIRWGLADAGTGKVWRAWETCE
ncbi:unnamed protein product [Symbiodinium pilosum]|uniref:Uncharacterized protein n=1 Tax=Symbiodinium pilosum TaxID=2952 RepID=A0A812QYG6_SYMPI|nr:unnamed protein product [Symbiodinium pilosum]